MAQDVTIAIALAVLVVSSGCAGLFSTSGSTASPTPAAPRTYDHAVENHAETLREIGQFMVRWERSETFPDRVVNRSPVTNEFVADIDSRQFLVGGDLEDHNGLFQSGAWYQSGSTTWQRILLDNGSTVYRRMPSNHSFTARNYTLQQVRVMAVYSKQFPLERNGTTVFQGQRVTRYTADELGPNERCLTDSAHVVENVTAVTVVALVDDRGIIRKFECRLTGETITGERYRAEVVWTVTMIGTAEIRAPDPVRTETN